MSHTPGPWVIDYEGTVGHIKAFVGDKTPTVCKYGTDYRGERHSALEIEHQDDANARLIAAAPELYDSLKELLDICRVKCSPHDEQILPNKTNHDAMLDACDILDRIRKI